MGQNTILQEVTQDDTWNTVSYAVARPLTVQALAGSAATALDFRMAAAAAEQHGCGQESWFNDVSFVGDSLTQGMQLYEEGMQNAMFCAYKGVGPERDRQRHHLQACRWHDRGAAGSPDRPATQGRCICCWGPMCWAAIRTIPAF